MKEKLRGWAERVSENKKGSDKMMFDDLMNWVYSRLENSGYEGTYNWLKDNYEKGINNNMIGRLLAVNSKQIKDKLWSLNKKK